MARSLAIQESFAIVPQFLVLTLGQVQSRGSMGTERPWAAGQGLLNPTGLDLVKGEIFAIVWAMENLGLVQ
ncbi:hypothetical protein IVB14_06385 [Bradyrhizobium sp. 180]|uniref:hypothetical protein n=1 Tax=unclassified Bradyrhizobium TaxID=2631580 RepID=UPI001FF8F8F6|nr:MULTISPECIES: hypothetical protein [unclassified Bradyrhizobium]MCK1490063.1 hypothetical protein [Bradyrhizobium sp. 180]MCK1542352.1 hypothetical protein [Bradyrhizobium sp. 179]